MNFRYVFFLFVTTAWLNLSYAEKHGYGNFANVLVSDTDIGQHKSECVKVCTQQGKKISIFYFGHGSAIVSTKKKKEWEWMRKHENEWEWCPSLFRLQSNKTGFKKL